MSDPTNVYPLLGLASRGTESKPVRKRKMSVSRLHSYARRRLREKTSEQMALEGIVRILDWYNQVRDLICVMASEEHDRNALNEFNELASALANRALLPRAKALGVQLPASE
jgi:hypothetical protein